MENMKLYKALAEFRRAATVGKSGKNPMFKSQYTTLGDVLSALNEIDEFGLSFYQNFQDGELITTVTHLETGEKFSSFLKISPEKDTPQSFISCSTYYRRASLMTMFGLNADDDDGNLASQRGAVPSRPQPAHKGPVAASTPAAGPTIPEKQFVEELDRCKTVREVNALFTKYEGQWSDLQLDDLRKRKEELK